jgi:hypothetical protein
VAVLLIGCARSVTPAATLSDASVDAPVADRADAGSPCAAGDHVAYALPLLPGTSVSGVAAIVPTAIDGTFMIGGDLVLGYRAIWQDEPPSASLLTTYAADTANLGTARIDGLALDAHGNATVVGTYAYPPVTIEGVSIGTAMAGAQQPWGYVARVVTGAAPTVTTLGPDTLEVYVAQRGDGIVVAGTGSIDLGAYHCDVLEHGGYIAAFGFDGTLEWLRCLISDGPIRLRGVATDEAGDGYLIAEQSGSILAIDAAPTIALRGERVVARFDASGALSWARDLGFGTMNGVAVAGSRVVAVGSGGLVVLDAADGTDLATGHVGAPNDDGLAAVAIDRCGNAWVVGSDRPSNGIVRRIDVNALGAWTTVVDVPGLDPTAIGISSDGTRVVVGGVYMGSPSVGGIALPPATARGWDPFVLGLR